MVYDTATTVHHPNHNIHSHHYLNELIYSTHATNDIHIEKPTYTQLQHIFNHSTHRQLGLTLTPIMQVALKTPGNFPNHNYTMSSNLCESRTIAYAPN